MRGSIGVYGAFGQIERGRASGAGDSTRPPVLGGERGQGAPCHRRPGGGLALLEQAIKESEYAPPPYLYVAADLALLQGKFAESRGYLERMCPTTAGRDPGL